MKSRHLLSAVALGLGLTFVLLLLLTLSTSPVRANPGIYYVRAGATGDCLSVATPCSSVQRAVDLAASPGDEVWVATGVYTENLAIVRGVKLRGGWNISFTTRSPITCPTIIDGSDDHVITAAVETGSALIEGFTVRNGRDGIHLYAGVITVTGNTVRDVTRQGIEVEGGQVLLDDNLITDIAREGIEIDGGAVTVRSNRVYTTGRHGILVQDGTVLVESNVVRTVTGVDYHGIQISGTHVTQVVSGNLVSDILDGYGIFARDGASRIVNNIVQDTGGDGIHVDDTCTDVELRGNTIYNAGKDGIDTRGQTPIVASNIINDAGKDGIHVELASPARIRHNTITGAADDCIDIGGDIAFVTGNLINGCGESGIKAEVVNNTSVVANQVYYANQDGKVNKAGINLDDAGAFTVTNNIVAESRWASVLVENGAGPHNFLYHNTLVGSAAGQQGTGLVVNVTGVTLTLVNNIVVSHSVGITATGGATLIVSNTLLWANGGGTLVLSGTLSLFAPPLFVNPAQQDYHILPDSLAVDAGADIGVTDDVDGDPRPSGDLPDIGADEVLFEVYLPLTLRAYPPKQSH